MPTEVVHIRLPRALLYEVDRRRTAVFPPVSRSEMITAALAAAFGAAPIIADPDTPYERARAALPEAIRRARTAD